MRRLLLILLGCLGYSASAGLYAENPYQLQGDFIQGGMIRGQADDLQQVMFNQQALRISPAGDFVFGFGRDFASSAELKLRFNSGQEIVKTLQIAPREYNIQRIEGIDKKITASKKPPETLARIRQETAQVVRARAKHIENLGFKQSFIWPLQSIITGVYGSQRVYNGQPGRPHYGIDIAAPNGTPVLAPADGQVTMAHPDMFYSGGTLIIDHGYGISSSFLHLSEILVQPGDAVQQGQVVAKVGQGGRSTGPHLDWRMNWYKQRIDPSLLVPPMPKPAADP